jgi:hypothetical protein
LKFQRYTCLDITESEIGKIHSASQNISEHWKRIVNKPECDVHRVVENIFEDVRLEEYPELPSRKACLFLFDLALDPIKYAETMPGVFPEQLNLVEVEIIDTKPNIVRVDKSLLTLRIEWGKLMATPSEIIADARMYWSGITWTNLDEEILFSGKYKYTRVICPPRHPFEKVLIKMNEICHSDI